MLPSFAGKRVYVTGATGFIGRYVVRRLLAQGAAVTALVRPRTDARDLEADGVAIHRGTILEPDTIRPEGHDLVIHGAAWVGFGIPKRKIDVFWRTNVGGTRNVLDAARRAGVRKAVHVSSIAVIGETRGEVADETFVRGDRYKSVYERSKLEAHRIAAEYDDLAITMPMPGVVVGRGSDWDLVFRSYAHGRLPGLPRGDGATGFVHVEDTANGILLAAAKGRGPYILVDENLTFQQLFAGLEKRTGLKAPKAWMPIPLLDAGAWVTEAVYGVLRKHPPIGKELMNGLKADMRYSSARARKELGWEPDLFGRMATDVLHFRGER